jgi:hypothetical protein
MPFLTRAAAGLFCLSVLGMLLPASAEAPLLTEVESYPGGKVIFGYNTGYGSGIEGLVGANGGYGVLGLAEPKTASSIGVYGLTNGPGSMGVYAQSQSTDYVHPSVGLEGVSKNGDGIWGLTLRPDAVGVLATNGLGTTGVAMQAIATGNGLVASSSHQNGVLGSSNKMNGIVGQTLFNSGISGNGFAGVLGQDLSTDAGVGNAGVAGTSIGGYGVEGTTTGDGSGVAGFSTTGVGVYGSSPGSFGLLGTASAIGAEGTSATGIGVVADSSATPDPSGVNGPPALEVSTDGGAPAIKVAGNTGDVFSLDADGNLIVGGNLTVDGNLSIGGTNTTCAACPSPLARPQRTSANAFVGTYAPEQTVRSIEDVGEGQLVDGAAFVRLDPAFAAASDPKSAYLVFITPQGESNGLYVTQKSRAGFAVRENGSGRSTLAFDYRIVAHPYGSSETRLPLLASHQSAVERPLHTNASLLARIRRPGVHRAPQVRDEAGFVPAAPRTAAGPRSPLHW